MSELQTIELDNLDKTLALWTEDNSRAALREGWTLSVNSGEVLSIQCQKLDDPDMAALEVGFTVPVIETDDDAMRILFKGTQPHHLLAKEILQTNSPAEWQLVLKAASFNRASEEETTDPALITETSESTKEMPSETSVVKTKDGQPFTIQFTPGIPNDKTSDFLYLLYDGSVCMGTRITVDEKEWIVTQNPCGGTSLNIALNKVIGHALALPQRNFS